MNLQNFKEVYTKIITESTDDSDLKNYIRTIVEELIGEAEGRKKTNQIVISKKFYPKLHAAIRDVQEPINQEMGWPIINYFDPEEHDEASFRAAHDRLEKILGKPVKTNAEIKEIKAFLKGYDTTSKRSIYNMSSGNRPGEGFDKDGYPNSRDADKLYNNNPDRYKD